MTIKTVDPRLRAATFRLVTGEGLAGTGFLATTAGHIITCDHVARHANLKALCPKGVSWDVERVGVDDADLRRADIAILRLLGAQDPWTNPLPLLAQAPQTVFRTRAQLLDGAAFKEAAPLEGRLSGQMTIAYLNDDRSYAFEGCAVTGLAVVSGMSGAAIWDVNLAAVVGVLAVASPKDRNIGGFASLFSAVETSTLLQSILVQNDDEAPRFGQKPNALGARDILRFATAHSVQRLMDREIYLPEKQVPREGFDAAISDFLASSASVAMIVSRPGDGKTAVLADLVTRTPRAWLVRAADLSPNVKPSVGLQQLLEEAVSDCDVQWGDLTGPSYSLFLDGLNELTLPADQIVEEWLPDLLGALTSKGWRLLITIRPELAEAIRLGPSISRFHQFSSAGDHRYWLVLGPYSQSEARIAAARYQLPMPLVHQLGRRPLLMSMAAGGHHGPKGRTGVLEDFVERNTAKAARLIKDHPARIRDCLEAIAEAAGENNGFLPYTAVLAGDPSIQALCQANLIEQITVGYRFVFDEVADYMRARRLSRRIEQQPQTVAEAEANLASLALEDLSTRAPGAMEKAAQCLLERSVNQHACYDAFVVLAGLPSSPVVDAIKAGLVERVLETGLIDTLFYMDPDLVAALPQAAAEKLLVEYVLAEDGYGWREKDVWSAWHRGSTIGAARLEVGAGRIVHDLLSDPTRDAAGFLITLLRDKRRLSHDDKLGACHEATLGSWALCMLLAYRELVGLPRIFEQVILAGPPGAKALMEALAAEEGPIFAKLLVQLPTDRAIERLSHVMNAWHELFGSVTETERPVLRQAAELALTPLLANLSGERRARLLRLCVTNDLTLPFDLHEELSRLDAPAEEMRLLIVTSVLRGRLCFAQAVEIADQNQIAASFAWALANLWQPESGSVELRDFVPVLARNLTDEVLGDARVALERMVPHIGLAEALSTGFCDLIERAIEKDSPAVITNLAYAAFFGRTERAPQQAALAEWLVPRLVESPHAARARRIALQIASDQNVFGLELEAFIHGAGFIDLLPEIVDAVRVSVLSNRAIHLLRYLRERSSDSDRARYDHLLALCSDSQSVDRTIKILTPLKAYADGKSDAGYSGTS